MMLVQRGVQTPVMGPDSRPPTDQEKPGGEMKSGRKAAAAARCCWTVTGLN